LKTISKLLILGDFAAALGGWVVASGGRLVRTYVAVPAPYLVVRPYGYYGPR
jgi:hypothetical protein